MEVVNTILEKCVAPTCPKCSRRMTRPRPAPVADGPPVAGGTPATTQFGAVSFQFDFVCVPCGTKNQGGININY